MVGLEASLKHTLKYLDQAPDYCILNFCRLLYSYATRNVVVSKRAAAVWTIEHFPEQRQIIETTLRVFERDENWGDQGLLQSGVRGFYQFLCSKIAE